jgi:hypothetical protein
MSERPIIFSGPMVLALRAGAKTQTRRVIKPQPKVEPRHEQLVGEAWATGFVDVRCPYGEPGDRLWVRETWRPEERASDLVDGIRFAADDAFVPIENSAAAADRWLATLYTAGPAPVRRPEGVWRSPIHMPRWASRLTLEVGEVRVERLHAITEADARAEGIVCELHPTDLRCGCSFARARFEALWSDIHGPASWSANPWVWVVGFQRVEASDAP